MGVSVYLSGSNVQIIVGNVSKNQIKNLERVPASEEGDPPDCGQYPVIYKDSDIAKGGR